jgi:hypothetical protein
MTPSAVTAAAIDEHVRRLALEGIHGSALVPLMSGHLMPLQRIYETVSDRELLALCERYPHFAAFAEMMEDLSEAERRQPPLHSLGPPLADPLRADLAAALATAATLELGFGTPGLSVSRRAELQERHRRWVGEMGRCRQALAAAPIPEPGRSVVLGQLDQTIARLAVFATAS